MGLSKNDIEDLLFKYTLSVKPCAHARIGALITNKGRILSFGYNQYKSHPLQKRFGRNSRSIFLHAEIDAIRNVFKVLPSFDLSRCTIWISRVKWNYPNGKLVWGLAKPCEGCQEALDYYSITNIYYTNTKGMVKL